MNLPPPPPFEKTNQHIVPRFWQKGFAGASGRVYARYRQTADPEQGKALTGCARQANVADLMTSDWTYTIFDRWWRPSDEVENRLATVEGHLKSAIDKLHAGASIDLGLAWDLCRFVGLAACRTPEAMDRGHRRLKELARAYADVHSALSFAAFRDAIRTRFGVELSQKDYDDLRGRPRNDLLKTAEGIERMSRQDPVLPEQMALTGADVVAIQMGEMELSLIDAQGSDHFILGDRPLPDFDMAKGFSLPLSKSIALRASKRLGEFQLPVRQVATSIQVGAVNLEQYDRSVDVVIGPDAAVLDALASQ